MSQEDGLSNAVEAFYRNLPISNMICEVSIFLGEIRLATIKCPQCGLNMCSEIYELVHWGNNSRSAREERVFQCSSVDSHKSKNIKYVNWTKRRLHLQNLGASAAPSTVPSEPEPAISAPPLISGIAEYSKSILANLLSAASSVSSSYSLYYNKFAFVNH